MIGFIGPKQKYRIEVVKQSGSGGINIVTMMSYRLLVYVVILAGLLEKCDGVPPQREVGDVKCVYDDRSKTMTMRFTAKLNDDPITLTYGLLENEVTNEFTYTDCSHTVINENGVEYLVVTTIINSNNPNSVTAVNSCGFQSVTRPHPDDGTPDEGFRILLALRQYEGFQTEVGGMYNYTCYMRDAINTFITSRVDLLVPDAEKPAILKPNIDFHIVRQRINEIGYTRNNSCVVGERVKLRLTLTSDYRDHLTPWGLAVSSTRVAGSENTLKTASADMLINQDGCEVAGNKFDFSGEWRRLPSSTRSLAIYETGSFECKRYKNSDKLWFGTYFDLCIGVYEGDEACFNLCESNQNRRKRQAGNDTANTQREIHTYISVIDENDGDHFKQQSSMSVPMIITIVVASVAILIVSVAFVAFLCNRRRINDKSSDVDSRASSDRKFF
ncbi:hypothetical protein ACF0H5_004783 [Mactra antiquata]